MDKFVIRQPRTREHPEEDTQTEPTVKKACLSSSEARIKINCSSIQLGATSGHGWNTVRIKVRGVAMKKERGFPK